MSPSYGDFIARYPEFTATTQPLVEAVLQEATNEVGERWLEKDRAKAQMLLTAHLLTTEGEPDRSQSSDTTGPTRAVKSMKVGDVAVELGAATTVTAQSRSKGIDSYLSTIYGQRYLALMRVNFPPIVTI